MSMKKIYFGFISLCFSINLYSQTFENSEIGIDCFFGASNQGGSFGLGVKYGLKSPSNENFVYGPSFRLMRYWSNAYLTNYTGHANIIGGGLFAHYRIQNILFIGTETEMLKNPYAIVNNVSKAKWVPNFFIGGGFSKEYNEKFRLNVGVFYDVITDKNSPFRTSYVMKKTDPITHAITGYLPVIYRIALFIRL